MIDARQAQMIIDKVTAEAAAASGAKESSAPEDGAAYRLPLSGGLEGQGQEPTGFSFATGLQYGKASAPVAAPSTEPEPTAFSFARGIVGGPAASGAPSSPAASAPDVGSAQSFKPPEGDESFPTSHSLADPNFLKAKWDTDLAQELAKERG